MKVDGLLNPITLPPLSRLRIWAPSLGLCFGLALLSLALGPFALVLCLMQLILLALEAIGNIDKKMMFFFLQAVKSYKTKNMEYPLSMKIHPRRS